MQAIINNNVPDPVAPPGGERSGSESRSQAVGAARTKGEAIGQATLRALAALLLPLLAAATRAVEESADSVAAEPSGPDLEDGEPRTQLPIRVAGSY